MLSETSDRVASTARCRDRAGPRAGPRAERPPAWQWSPGHPLGEGHPSRSLGWPTARRERKWSRSPASSRGKQLGPRVCLSRRTPCPQPWWVPAGPGPGARALVSALPPILPFVRFSVSRCSHGPPVGPHALGPAPSAQRSAAARRVALVCFLTGPVQGHPSPALAVVKRAFFPLTFCSRFRSLRCLLLAEPRAGPLPWEQGVLGVLGGRGSVDGGKEARAMAQHPALLPPRPPVRSFLVSDLVAQLPASTWLLPPRPRPPWAALGRTGLRQAPPGGTQHAHGCWWEALGGATSRGPGGPGAGDRTSGASGALLLVPPPSEVLPTGPARALE